MLIKVFPLSLRAENILLRKAEEPPQQTQCLSGLSMLSDTVTTGALEGRDTGHTMPSDQERAEGIAQAM